MNASHPRAANVVPAFYAAICLIGIAGGCVFYAAYRPRTYVGSACARLLVDGWTSPASDPPYHPVFNGVPSLIWVLSLSMALNAACSSKARLGTRLSLCGLACALACVWELLERWQIVRGTPCGFDVACSLAGLILAIGVVLPVSLYELSTR